MTTLPDLTLLPYTDSSGRALFRLNENFEYTLGPGCVVTVPKGYVTNFGTIPKFLAWFIAPSQLREAAIVHDWMTNEDFVDDGVDINSGWSRELADAILKESMRRLGFGWYSRVIVYFAVRGWAIASGKTKKIPVNNNPGEDT